MTTTHDADPHLLCGHHGDAEGRATPAVLSRMLEGELGHGGRDGDIRATSVRRGLLTRAAVVWRPLPQEEGKVRRAQEPCATQHVHL